MTVQVTIAEGRDMVRRTFPEGRTARYEWIDDQSRFGQYYPNLRPVFLIVRDQYNRTLASFPQRDVLDVYAPFDP